MHLKSLKTVNTQQVSSNAGKNTKKIDIKVGRVYTMLVNNIEQSLKPTFGKKALEQIMPANKM